MREPIPFYSMEDAIPRREWDDDGKETLYLVDIETDKDCGSVISTWDNSTKEFEILRFFNEVRVVRWCKYQR